MVCTTLLSNKNVYQFPLNYISNPKEIQFMPKFALNSYRKFTKPSINWISSGISCLEYFFPFASETYSFQHLKKLVSIFKKFAYTRSNQIGNSRTKVSSDQTIFGQSAFSSNYFEEGLSIIQGKCKWSQPDFALFNLRVTLCGEWQQNYAMWNAFLIYQARQSVECSTPKNGTAISNEQIPHVSQINRTQSRSSQNLSRTFWHI